MPVAPWPAPKSTSVSVLGDSPSVVVVADAQAVAQQWLVATRSTSFKDKANSWVARAMPYVTGKLRADYVSLAADASGGGATWDLFVKDGCTTRVAGVGSVIPPEAPASPSVVYISVTGALVTSCITDQDPSTQPAAALVELVKVRGQWLVSSRIY